MNFQVTIYFLILSIGSVFLKENLIQEESTKQVHAFYEKEINTFIKDSNINSILFEEEEDVIHLTKIWNNTFETKEFLTKIDFPLIVDQLTDLGIKDMSLPMKALRMKKGDKASLSAFILKDIINNNSPVKFTTNDFKHDYSANEDFIFYIEVGGKKINIPISDLDFIVGILAKKGILLTDVESRPTQGKIMDSQIHAHSSMYQN